MKSLIDKNKKISKQRQEFVEHNFEAMVGARKRRYNETPQQKQRTEFLEDYYLLYTRNKNKWQKLKEILKRQIDIDSKEYLESGIPIFKNYVAVENFILQKMQELEAEDVED